MTILRTLLALSLTLAVGGVFAQEAPRPADKDKPQRTSDALQTIRKVLQDLPPGPETDQIRAALEKLDARIGDVKTRVDLAKADVEQRRDRATWTERMARKGYMTQAQAEIEKVLLKAAEANLEKAQKELNGLLGQTKP